MVVFVFVLRVVADIPVNVEVNNCSFAVRSAEEPQLAGRKSTSDLFLFSEDAKENINSKLRVVFKTSNV